MTGFGAALWVEGLKARRSRVLLLVGLGFMLVPAFGGLAMIILKDPAVARQLGLISAKAQLTAGTADWPTYLGMLAQAVAIGGIMLFAIATSWMFGREYADRTAKDLMALPTSRAAIVVTKLVILIAWAFAVSAGAAVLGLVIGSAIGLPQGSPAVLWQGIRSLAVTTALSLCFMTPVALVASAGRGYLAPMGYAILTLFLAQVVLILGWGAYFPWSVPALQPRGR